MGSLYQVRRIEHPHLAHTARVNVKVTHVIKKHAVCSVVKLVAS
jgi:hypothetical protein